MDVDIKKNEKVFVAMSGGVDSSVTAYLLKEAGADVTGVFMRCFNVDGCAERDAEDARRVAEHLNIPFYVWDFEDEYKKKVVEYMVEGYARGETPNPDVMCNKEIKFGLFLERALELGAEKVATGHYTRLQREIINNKSQITNSNKKDLPAVRYSLHIACDDHKDQSYFLWTLTQDDLRHCLFPLGDYDKAEVREIAESAGLPVADKPDSQGICFLGRVSLQEFLSDYIDEEPGPIVDEDGEEIGEHKGAWFYTIGQRSLGVSYNPNVKGRDPEPHYVAKKDLKTNTLVMAEGRENPALFTDSIRLRNLNFINPEFENRAVKEPQKIEMRVRYNQQLFGATIREEEGGFTAEFDEPQKFIAPGQSAVFYSDEGAMLGGGVIVDRQQTTDNRRP